MSGRPFGLLRKRHMLAHDGCAGMSDLELHQWFEPGELDRCPVCGEPAGVSLPATAAFVCLGCGHVSAGAPKASEDAAPNA
jgi:hypothetical protein